MFNDQLTTVTLLGTAEGRMESASPWYFLFLGLIYIIHNRNVHLFSMEI